MKPEYRNGKLVFLTFLRKLLKIISLKWQILPASQVEEQELIFH